MYLNNLIDTWTRDYFAIHGLFSGETQKTTRDAGLTISFKEAKIE